MPDLTTDLKQAIHERNFPASSHILEHIRTEGKIDDTVEILEEEYESSTHHNLELRDHVTNYLGLWDVYFAVQMSSIDLLRLLREDIDTDVSEYLLQFIRNLLKDRDSRFDHFFISIEILSKGSYAVLLPEILTIRTDELEDCAIYFQTGVKPLYCTTNLLRTYYGQRIISAILNENAYESVVSEKTFYTIESSLKSAGLDVSKMLVPVEPKDWDDIICKLDVIGSKHDDSKELATMHRVYQARSEIFLDSFRKQTAALEIIHGAKTQLCNDILMYVALNPQHEMQLRALKAIGEIGDSTMLDFLSRMIGNSDTAVRNVAARSFSTLSSHSKWSTLGHKIPAEGIKPASLDISKINRILNRLIAKGMPIDMIEDTLVGIVTQGDEVALDILLKLMKKPHIIVRKAVVKTSRLLGRETAAKIIKIALYDDSPEVVSLAEKEINSRWPDQVWE